jgi:hypothetical protein
MTVQGKRPILALEIDIEEVFFHCAKGFLRSDAWKPESWDPTAVPSVARIAKAMKKDMDLAELRDVPRRGQHAKDPLLAGARVSVGGTPRDAGERAVAESFSLRRGCRCS